MKLLKHLLRAHWAWLGLVALALIAPAIGAAFWLIKVSAGADRPVTYLVPVLIVLLVLAGARAVSGRRVLTCILIIIKLRDSYRELRRRSFSFEAGAPASVTLDKYGVPTIDARSRLDAVRALGYLTARDRLFQMDLIRREAAGRLSEVFGEATLALDVSKRVVGLDRAAKDILVNLPGDQREVLEAYADGVNDFIRQTKHRSFEFFLLRYRPDPWSPKDSLLVILHLFQLLCGDDEPERMLSIMRAALPPEAVNFFTPDTDSYASILFGRDDADRPGPAIPVAELASLLGGYRRGLGEARRLVRSGGPVAGSNCWAVDGSKTFDGRSILANDMHLPLRVPNYWYMARLRYEGVNLSGVLIPGIPVVLAGSNGRVAWGLTNLCGNCLDLIPLEINPANPAEYRTEDGWREFRDEREEIGIRGGRIITQNVRITTWGPVSEKPLLGRPVALRWMALDPSAVDVGFLNIDGATDVEEAVRIVNNFGGPPLNVLVADWRGRVAYTVCGRFPARNRSKTSAEERGGGRAGEGNDYVPPGELPRVINPSSGSLVTANNRVVGTDYPYVLGRNYANGYRAYHIRQRLMSMTYVNEGDMLELQLDTTSGFYEFYRQLAIKVITQAGADGVSDISAVRSLLAQWDGKAELGSRGLALLVYFRDALAESVFAPFLQACVKADPQFTYCWQNFETPLRLLLSEQPAELLPEAARHPTWNSFLMEILRGCVSKLKQDFKAQSATEVNWGRVNRSNITHPLSFILPELRAALNMPSDQQPGGLHCVCVSAPSYGASVRMVVSPGREAEGILSMPCGQSEHPFSDNYDDFHKAWLRRKPKSSLPRPAAVNFLSKPEAYSPAETKKSPTEL